jgi:hypothetical protein
MARLPDVVFEHWALVVPDRSMQRIIRSADIRSFLKGNLENIVQKNDVLLLSIPFKNGEYPRTELIEINPMDGSQMYWHCGTVTKHLSVEFKFTDICHGASLVLCHLDGYQHDSRPLQIRYNCWEGKGYCNILYKTTPGEYPKLKCLVSDIPMDAAIRYSVDISPTGGVTVTINGISFEFDLDRQWNSYSLRFITGIRVDTDSHFYLPLQGKRATAAFSKISLTKK